MSEQILVLNLGSSSIKFSIYQFPEKQLKLSGKVENINNNSETILIINEIKSKKNLGKIFDFSEALKLLFDELELEGFSKNNFIGVGHRVVHGGEKLNKSVLIDDKVEKIIEENIKLAPLHNPVNLAGIKAVKKILGEIPQVAVFDTAFHQTMPQENYIYPIPFEYYEKYGIRRFGFHGISVMYIMRKLQQIVGSLENKRVIVAHIGSGASITAIKDGKSIINSMGFTPLEGVMMATRSGDIDPGVILYLLNILKIPLDKVDEILNKKSGLMGIYGDTAHLGIIVDEMNKGNKKAKLAVKIFVNKIAEKIGGYIALMSGVDYLVLTGGVMEKGKFPQPAIIRKLVLEKFEYIGIEIDESENKYFEDRVKISKNKTGPQVYVIPTNEEFMIAQETYMLIKDNI